MAAVSVAGPMLTPIVRMPRALLPFEPHLGRLNGSSQAPPSGVARPQRRFGRGGEAPETDAAFWEQDFGAWEGRPFSDLPDLGALSPDDLAAHCPPGGESFADLCHRVGPALTRVATGGRVAVVAHAGVVRAGLALALGAVPQALSFEVAPLSVTRLRRLAGNGWSVTAVNWGPG